MDADRKQALKERVENKRLKSSAEKVDLDPGDEVFGEVIEDTTMDTEYGEFRLAYIRDEDEVYSLPIEHTALVSQWEEEGVGVGDDVLVIYEGETTSEAGMEYHNYTVAKA